MCSNPSRPSISSRPECAPSEAAGRSRHGAFLLSATARMLAKAWSSSPQHSRSTSPKPAIHHCALLFPLLDGAGLTNCSPGQLCESICRWRVQKTFGQPSHLPTMAFFGVLHCDFLPESSRMMRSHLRGFSLISSDSEAMFVVAVL